MNESDVIGELERLYRERYRQFLRVAIAVIGDEAAAHDVVQEGFARALRARGSYRGEGTVEAWLWPILLNAARAAYSDRPGASGELAESAATNGHVPADDVGVVRAWVSLLPERQRLAVFLRYYADLDYRSIAAALGIETGTVSATLSAAHETLRRSLEEVS